MNKWIIGIVVSTIFTALWGGIIIATMPSRINSCHDSRKYCKRYIISMWAPILVLGIISFLVSSGHYIKNRTNNNNQENENQGTEANNNIELPIINENQAQEVIDENQKALEDLEKEIAVLKKQKERAKLKKEIRELEGVIVEASTSV